MSRSEVMQGRMVTGRETSGPPELPCPPEWMAQASCRGMATADWDPWHPGQGNAPVLYAVGRRVCRGCPVRLECLRTGLRLLGETPHEGGMYAGLTPAELRGLARRLGLPSRHVAQHGITRSGYVAGCRCVPCRRINAAGEHQRRLERMWAGAQRESQAV